MIGMFGRSLKGKNMSSLPTGGSPPTGGPLTRVVLDYERTIRQLVPGAKNSADWAPLTQFVATDEFERVGCFLEVQNWQQYTQMLSQWVSATARFETTVRRIRELPDAVYYEIEERHFHGDKVDIVNSMTVFVF